MPNPLIDDRTLSFFLYDVLNAGALPEMERYTQHSRESFDMMLQTASKWSREVLFPTLRKMDVEPCELKDGRVHTHPEMGRLYAHMAEQGYLTMSRPEEVGGMALPVTIGLAVCFYLNAANVGAACFIGLTTGAGHLIESFGNDALKKTYMEPMYTGRWTGTMALTEPHAGSSLGDIKTRAVPQPDGSYLITGDKVFISGGDNTFSENIVHLALGRIDGAPAGSRGVSLFVVPKKRVEGDTLVDNDAKAVGLFHKMGWKGLPSIALKFGEEGQCRGWLVGKAGDGLKCMFQMMNEARLSVGLSAAANASVAFHEALEYAKTRPQGRSLTNRDAGSGQIPIIEHADVRRMLLAQKSIAEGSILLLLRCGRYFDESVGAASDELRQRGQKLLDLLTPIAKTFPSEKGFEANALSVQVHGGYGYTAEYLPELLLREQKLNTLHEGTTGIQSLDLLGRKIFMDMGLSVGLLSEEIALTMGKAQQHAALKPHADALAQALVQWQQSLATLAARAQSGDMEAAMQTSAWHMELASIIVVAWLWLDAANAAAAKSSGDPFYAGKLAACAYWFEAELPKAAELNQRICRETVAYRDVAAAAL